MRLRIKLVAICALAAAVPLIAVSIVIVQQVSASARTARIEKLDSEARAAESIYEKRLIEMRSAAQGLADEIAAKSLFEADHGTLPSSGSPSHHRLQDLLERSHDELSLDFLIVADAEGKVVARHNDNPQPGETLIGASSRNPIADEVINAGSHQHVISMAALVVERGEFLARMWLSDAAKIQSAPSAGALIVESGAPIMSSGRFLGIVLSGQMLNKYYKSGRPGSSPIKTPIVTEVRQRLYPGIEQGAGSLVALGDTVIASSLLPSPTSEPVLVGWKHDPAKNFEMATAQNQQYAISWRPLKSVDGADVGAIGVAVSGNLLTVVDPSLIPTLAIAIAATVALVALAGASWAAGVSKRLGVLSDAVSRMMVGELSTEVRDSGGLPRWIPGLGSRPSDGLHQGNGSQPGARDEIEELAENLDRMRESFKQAIERLRRNR